MGDFYKTMLFRARLRPVEWGAPEIRARLGGRLTWFNLVYGMALRNVFPHVDRLRTGWSVAPGHVGSASLLGRVFYEKHGLVINAMGALVAFPDHVVDYLVLLGVWAAKSDGNLRNGIFTAYPDFGCAGHDRVR